jgi:uncharacterized membrane protein YtjA (UPF0391 family)
LFELSIRGAINNYHGKLVRITLTFSSLIKKEIAMLYYALVFLVVALIAAALGFGGIAGASASIAQVLFYIFLILFVVSLAMRVMRRP